MGRPAFDRAEPADIRAADTHPIAVFAAGVLPPAAASPAAAPEAAGVVHVLRRHGRHLLAGVLLGHTSRPLTEHQAKSWATRRLAASTTSLLPWKPVDEADPDSGWHTSSGLLVERYALYRHPSGWQLLGAVTRAARPQPVTDADAHAWAADILKPSVPLTWAHGSVTWNTTTWYAKPPARTP